MPPTSTATVSTGREHRKLAVFLDQRRRKSNKTLDPPARSSGGRDHAGGSSKGADTGLGGSLAKTSEQQSAATTLPCPLDLGTATGDLYGLTAGLDDATLAKRAP